MSTHQNHSFDLTRHGLTVTEIHRNLPPGALYEHAIRYEKDASIADNGALVACSGIKTGRSPKDKRVVSHPERISLKHTRAIIDAIHSGDLIKVRTERDSVFGFEIVVECSGVPGEMLRPRDCWKHQVAYDAAASRLAGLSVKNFETYAAGASAAGRSAAPKFDA